jgi:hypothetical protein
MRIETYLAGLGFLVVVLAAYVLIETAKHVL